jgi:hypothetical protein
MVVRRRRLYWIVGGTVVLLAALGVGLYFAFRNTTTPVTADRVTSDLDGLVGDGTPGSPGVYAYATTGFEEVDAFGGGRHDYPPETFLTLRPEGCGTGIRWHPLEERFEEDVVCADGSLDVINSYHEWFGVPDFSAWECSDGARTLPRGDETAWSFTCEKPGESEQVWEYRVVGEETIEVGGEPVETLHVVGTETITGRTVGGSENHQWVLVGTLLPVRRTSVGENTTESAIGPVRYNEEFEITLVSLEPRS